jgi:hypothetical protein
MRKALVLLTALAVALSVVGIEAASAKKKKKKPCPAFVGTEEAQEEEAELLKVTDEATEEEPVETTVEVPPGIPEVGEGHAYVDVQADPKAKETGLYVRFEFPSHEDNDLYLLNPDGEEAASAAGFNPFTPLNPGDENGGHSESGAEQIDGLATADCQGYTADLTSYMSFGGEMTVKAWLGEVGGEEEEDG